MSDDMFLNAVLPYASLGETRENWRTDFSTRFSGLAGQGRSIEETVMALNREIFMHLGVVYGSPRRDMRSVLSPDVLGVSPSESRTAGRALCYGLSILLVDAARALGIPARAAFIPRWPGLSDGHGWVEIYDGVRWRYVGALDQSRLDDTWFTERVARSDPGRAEHRVYASSFRRTNLQSAVSGGDVWLEDVTLQYVKTPAAPP
jgi:hypothetical protein